jgi:hypothetical protein
VSRPFAAIWRLVTREPAVIISLIGAAVGVAASYGLHLSAAQTRDLLGGCAALVGIITRSAVTPQGKVPASIAALEARIAAVEPVAAEFVRVTAPAANPVVDTAERVLAAAENGAVF